MLNLFPLMRIYNSHTVFQKHFAEITTSLFQLTKSHLSFYPFSLLLRLEKIKHTEC